MPRQVPAAGTIAYLPSLLGAVITGLRLLLKGGLAIHADRAADCRFTIAEHTGA